MFRELGIRLVAWDRPGYGQSDPQTQRSFKTFAGAPCVMRGQTGNERQGHGNLRTRNLVLSMPRYFCEITISRHGMNRVTTPRQSADLACTSAPLQ